MIALNRVEESTLLYLVNARKPLRVEEIGDHAAMPLLVLMQRDLARSLPWPVRGHRVYEPTAPRGHPGRQRAAELRDRKAPKTVL